MQHLFNKIRGGARPQQDPQDPHSQPKLSLTEHLLHLDPDAYRSATQPPFLRLAAEGRLPKPLLGRWLASERLYFHSYIRAAGKLLSSLDLPRGVGKSDDDAVVKVVDWVIEDLVRIREEERRILDVAGRYGIRLEGEEVVSGPGVGPGPVEPRPASLGGRGGRLAVMEGVSDSVAAPAAIGVRAISQPNEPTVLPWLEAAVMFWGTERFFVDAWGWAKAQQPVSGDDDDEARDDADGGALRREFIPIWSGEGFKEFVARLQVVIDEDVTKEIERGGKDVREEVLRRTEGKWKSLVAGSESFWMNVDEHVENR